MTKWLKGLVLSAALLAIAFVSCRPLLVPRLIHAFDSLAHLYLLVHLDDLFERGIYYSRWLPYRISALGEPVFQYYPPLATYLAEGFHLLGADQVLAVRLVFALALIGGALGVFLWVRDILDGGAAVVAAAAYACAPHILFNTYLRGGLTEQLALACAPYALWALRRFSKRIQARYLAVAALALGAMILSHLLTAAIFVPVIGCYALLLTAHMRWAHKNKALWWLWIALALALGLAAFFWAPALLERDAVRTDLMSGSRAFDYHYHYVRLNDLFALPWHQEPVQALSVTAVALSFLGLLTVQHRGELDPLEVGWAALFATGCAFMVLPASVGVWDRLPLFHLFQFPYRFLGPATLLVAFLSAVGAYSLEHWTTRLRLPGLVLYLAFAALLVLPARGLNRIRHFDPIPEIDIRFVMQREREMPPVVAGGFHTVFIPKDAHEMPPHEIQARDGPERLDSDSLPEGARVLDSTYEPLYYRIVLDVPRSCVVRLNTFYYLGWQAVLDGAPVPIEPSERYGLIGVHVPPGEHVLIVRFATTPVRIGAGVVSVSSLLFLLVVVGVALATSNRKESSS